MKIKASVESQRRILDATVKNDDLKRRFPGAVRYKPGKNPDGEFRISLETKRDRMALAEMMQPEIDVRSRERIDVPLVAVRDARGHTRHVAEHVAPLIRTAVRHGGLRVERWSDGLLYRDNGRGGWEPLNRCAITTPYFNCKNPRCEACQA